MAFAPILGILGGVISAVGTISAGMAQKQAMDYQAQVANNNAIIAQQNANYAIEAGQSKAATQSLQEAERGGEIKAAQALSGVDVNTGSYKEVQKSQRMLGSLNTKQQLANAQLTEYGYLSQKTNYQAQAQLDTYQGKQAEIGGFLGGAGQIFGAASKWYSPSTFTTGA